MGDPMATTRRCSNCGSPLRSAEPGEPLECEFCHAEQLIEPTTEGSLEDDEVDTEEENVWLDDDQSISVLHEYLDAAADDYDTDDLTVELDEDNTDDERVYLYVKNEDDEVLDYFYVDREAGTLHIYDHDEEEWLDT